MPVLLSLKEFRSGALVSRNHPSRGLDEEPLDLDLLFLPGSQHAPLGLYHQVWGALLKGRQLVEGEWNDQTRALAI